MRAPAPYGCTARNWRPCCSHIATPVKVSLEKRRLPPSTSTGELGFVTSQIFRPRGPCGKTSPGPPVATTNVRPPAVVKPSTKLTESVPPRRCLKTPHAVLAELSSLQPGEEP